MIELIAEVAVLLLLVVAVLIATGATLTVLLAVVTILTARTALTVSVLAAWTARTLLITLGLVEKHAVRELVLTCLRIDLKELHLDVVTFFDASLLDSLEALPLDLRDMQQTFLARENLHEATVRHDALDNTVVDLTNLRDSHDSLDLSQGCVDALLVWSADLHVTDTVAFVDSDGSASLFLHLLDNLSTRANDSTDELLGDVEGLDTRYLRLQLLTRL